MPKTPPSCRNSKPPPPTSAVRRTTRDLKCEHEESAWWLRMFTDGPLCEHELSAIHFVAALCLPLCRLQFSSVVSTKGRDKVCDKVGVCCATVHLLPWLGTSPCFNFFATRATRSPSSRALSSSLWLTPGSSGPVMAAAPASPQTLPVLSF